MPSWAAIRDDPRFGGAWTDAQGVLHIAVTADADEIRETLSELIPSEMRVSFDSVRYSQQELEQLKDRIVEAETLPSLTFVGADPTNNRVTVGIDPFDQQRAAELMRRYGPMIEVVHQPVQQQL